MTVIESAIQNYELAYAMQMAVPEVMSISDQEPAQHLQKTVRIWNPSTNQRASTPLNA